MPRPRSVAALTLLVAGIAVLAIGWAADPLRISIRWTPDTTEPSRTAAETSLQLTAARPEGGRTWGYDLRDASRAHLEQITRHPAVEDWAGFTRDLTLKPDAPPLQAWLQVRYGQPSVKWLSATWWVAGPGLCVLAVIVAWPSVRGHVARADWRVAAVVLVAAWLRVSIIASGGQYYWPDERQYREARQVVAAMLAGDANWARELLATPSSVALKLFAFVPAGIEQLTGDRSWLPALFLGGCSVVSIWLIAAIARRLEATRDEAFIAALLAAGSATLLYMSRHLLSYDLALMLGLIGVWTGVRRDNGLAASVMTGVWAVAAFLAYAGAWTLAAAVCLIHLADAVSWRCAIRRTALTAAGIASVIVTMSIAYRLAGLSWLQRMVEFAGTVRQGEFDEGWRLPIEFLWHAERGLLVVWLAAAVWCLARFRWAVQTRLARAGLVGVACIYGGLALSSTVLEQFVVYGRLSRPIVPFLCLATAAAFGSLVARVPRVGVPAVVVAVLAVGLQAAFNFRVPLRQEFPAEFIARVERNYPEPRVFVNAKHLYPGPEQVAIPPGFREVAIASHPLEFTPYQYEGFAEGERRGLRSSDLRMRAYVARGAP